MATKITTPELFNLSSNNTAATQLPVFTKSTRPTPTTSTVTVDYLVVGGGGGGGNFDGGGGGAGGYLTNYNGTPISITTSNLYTVAVGEGGVGGQKSVITSGVGGNSIFDTIISYGGGGGASDNNTGPSSDGGSGGGAAGGSNPTIGLASPAGQGYNGGNSSGNLGGGGGGASEAGNTDGQGHGGDGLSNSITGTATFYAGGGGGDYRSGGYPGGDGGGAAGSGSLPSNNGTPNTGGGGGAIGGATNYQGGSGGSGIVILRYPTSSSLNITTTGSLVYTESTDGSDTVLQFTEGSGNFGFLANNITVGEMIFNSTTEKVEYWDGFQWNMIKDEEPSLSSTDPFGDGSQTALYKFAGNGNNENGTYTANVTASYITGILGGGVSFSGSSSSLVTSLQPLSLGQSKTFWVNFDSINFNANKSIYLSGGSTSSYNFWNIALYYEHSSGLWYIGQQVRNNTGVYWYTGTGYTLSNVSKTDWNLIYVSYNVGNFAYSINNSTIATNPKTISSGTVSSMSTDHDLGKIHANGPAYYTLSGTKISSMRQFNRVLSGSEIQQIYDQVY